VTRDVDPVIVRTVEQCLASDPAARPSSARAVLSAFPGGDPLAAALAAGETPSPEMVAAAGASGELRAGVAWSLFALAVGGIAALAVLSERTMLYRAVALPKSPEALQERAQTIAEHVGYTTPFAASGGEWTVNDAPLRWIAAKRAPRNAHPALYHRVTRFSTRPLLPLAIGARITAHDPAPLDPGMVDVTLDPDGKLVRFAAVPPDRVDARAANDVDWRPLFADAGADSARFHAVPAVWSAGQVAWDGTFADQPNVPVHIEAASRGGRAVAFRVYGPWDEPRPLRDPPRPFATALAASANIFIRSIVPLISAFFAVRNIRRGRGDRKGALRVAAFCTIVYALADLAFAEHRSILNGEWNVLEGLFGRALYLGGMVWLMYMAIEPYLRRRMPQTVIGWSRLLAGRWRDPMVGRDVLVGVLCGLAVDLALNLTRVAPGWFGLQDPPPAWLRFSILEGTSATMWQLLSYAGGYVRIALAASAFMVVLRVLLPRRHLVANVIFFLLMAAAFVDGSIGRRARSPGVRRLRRRARPLLLHALRVADRRRVRLRLGHRPRHAHPRHERLVLRPLAAHRRRHRRARALRRGRVDRQQAAARGRVSYANVATTGA